MSSRLPQVVMVVAVLALLALLGLAALPEPPPEPTATPQPVAQATSSPTTTSRPMASPVPPAPEATPRQDLPMLLLDASRVGTGLPLLTALAPDGGHLAVVTASGLSLYETRPLARRWTMDLTNPLTTLAFSPDGEQLVIGNAVGELLILEAEEAFMPGTPPPYWSPLHDGALTHIAFGLSGTLATASSASDVLLSQRAGDVVQRVELSGPMFGVSAIQQLLFSPSGDLVVRAMDDGGVYVWAVPRGEELAALSLGPGLVSLRFSEDGRFLYALSLPDLPPTSSLSHSETFKVRRWRTRDWTLVTEREATVPGLRALLPTFAEPLSVLTISDTTLQEWTLTEGGLQPTQEWGRVLPIFDMGSLQPRGVAAASTRNMFAWVQEARSLALWEFRQGGALLLEDVDPRTRLQFSADDSTLLAQTPDGEIYLWNTDDGGLLGSVPPSTEPIPDFAFSPDGSQLATGTSNGTILVWGMSQRGNPARLLSIVRREGEPEAVSALAYAPGGTLLAGVAGDQIFIWDAAARRWRHTIFVAGSAAPPRDLVVAADEESVRYIQGLELRKAPLLDTGDHARLQLSDVPLPDVPLVVSPDGLRSAVMINDGSVRVLLVEQDKVSRIVDIPHGWAGPFAFGKDWQTLATVDQKLLRLWQVDDVTLSWVVELGGIGRSIAASPDGAVFAVGLEDGRVQIRDPADGKLLAEIQAHAGPVTQLAFAPDGTLASSADNGVVRLWLVLAR